MLSLLRVYVFPSALSQNKWPCQWLCTEGLWPPPESPSVGASVLPAPQGMSPQLSGYHHLAARYYSNQDNVLLGPRWVIHAKTKYIILMIDRYNLGFTCSFISLRTYKEGIIILLLYDYFIWDIWVFLHQSFVEMALNLWHTRHLWDC